MHEHEDSLRSAVLSALKWAKEHPASDLTHVLPNLPFSNSDIHWYVGRVLTSLEDAGGGGVLGEGEAGPIHR